MSEYKTNRGKKGEEHVYASPRLLLAKANKYFAWCKDNPLLRTELIKSGARQGEMVHVPVVRPLTLPDLCVYCGIGVAAFRALGRRKEFAGAVDHIRNVIARHQIEGALLGNYSATVVAKLQWTDDKDEVQEQQPFTIIVRDEATAEQIRILERGGPLHNK